MIWAQFSVSIWRITSTCNSKLAVPKPVLFRVLYKSNAHKRIQACIYIHICGCGCVCVSYIYIYIHIYNKLARTKHHVQMYSCINVGFLVFFGEFYHTPFIPFHIFFSFVWGVDLDGPGETYLSWFLFFSQTVNIACSHNTVQVNNPINA